MATTEPARTLADHIRSWSDDQVAWLLTARPDLVSPAPQDSGQLASRATTRASAQRALDQLDLLELTVLDAVLAAGGDAPLARLQALVGADAGSIEAAADRLLAVALLWGRHEHLHALSVLRDILGTTVSGLGPPATTLLSGYGPGRLLLLARELGVADPGERDHDIDGVAAVLAEPAVVHALVAEVDAQAQGILDHLDTRCAEGTVESAERTVSRHERTLGPVDQLLARGLLMARGRKHVVVPREVGLVLRGGKTTHTTADAVPAVATMRRPTASVDHAAAGAAFELVRRVEMLLEHWGEAPPAVLRSGGLSVRDLRTAARLMHIDEAAAALHVETAAAAGLLAAGESDDGDAVWLPTDAFDLWASDPVAGRWATLAGAWLDSPRATGLVGTRDESNKTTNALAADLVRTWLPETRHRLLEQVASLPPDQVLAVDGGVPSLVERMRWIRPRRPALRADAVGWTVTEAATIGVLGLGGVSAHGRALLHDSTDRAATALEPLLPEPVDHVLLQADLTAVAPGPLTPDLSRTLSVVADVESRGGATVYRFTETSVRRAFDAGWSAAEVHDFVASTSRTPVPQPLVYLVDDVARRFGTLRVGVAESFLRSDDESAVAELVHDPRAASLRLRRIAPTVAVSDVPVDVVLERLRALGSAPVVEGSDGTVRLTRFSSRRSRAGSPTPRKSTTRTASTDADRVGATVRAIRAGDRARARRPPGAEQTIPARTSPASTLAVLRESVEVQGTVWIGYVDNHGATVERLVRPVRVEGGWLRAYDQRSDDVRSFAVHRITTVAPVG